MTNLGTAILEIQANTQSLDQSLQNVEGQLHNLEGTAMQAGQSLDMTAASVSMDQLVKGVTAAGTAIGGMRNSAEDLIQASFDSAYSVEVVFGEAADTVLAFADTAAQSVGMSNKAFNELAVPIGSVTKQLAGLSDAESAQWAIDLASRASDLAYVFNTDVATAMNAITSALQGQSQPMMQFGVSVSAAAAEQEALAMTGKSAASELTEQEKVLGRLNLVMSETDHIAGSFAGNMDLVYNQQQVLNAEWENMRAAMGEKLLPVQGAVLGVMSEMPPALQMAAIGASEFGGDAIGLAGSLGQVSVGLAGLPDMLKATSAGFTRMAGAAATLGPIAIGVAGIATAAVALNQAIEGNGLPEWADALGHVADPTDRFNIAMNELGGSVEGANLKTILFVQSLKEEADAAEAGAKYNADLAAATGEVEEAVDDAAIAAEEYAGKIADLNSAYEDLTGSANDALGAIQQFEKVPTAEMELLNIEIRAAKRHVEELTDAQAAGQDIAQETIDRAEAHVEALERERNALSRARDETIDKALETAILTGNVEGLTMTEIEANRAILEATGALSGQRGEVAELTPEVAELAERQHELDVAFLTGAINAEEYGRRTSALRGEMAELAGETTGSTNPALDASLERLGKLSANPWGVKVEDVDGEIKVGMPQGLANMLELMGIVSGTVIRINVDSSAVQFAIGQLGALRDAVGRFEEIANRHGQTIRGRAEGGPVNAMEVYRVGERGPELFVPFADGQIIPHHEAREMLAEPPAYRNGTSYVPADGMAMLHRGEEVRSPEQARQGRGAADFVFENYGPISVINNGEERDASRTIEELGYMMAQERRSRGRLL